MIAYTNYDRCQGCDSTCVGRINCSWCRYSSLVLRNESDYPLEPVKVKSKSYSKFIGKSQWKRRKKGGTP